MRNKCWMIVANGSVMKLFKFDTLDRNLHDPVLLVHPQSTLMQGDFDSSKAGHASDTYGNHNERISSKTLEEEKFAKQISELLEKAHLSGDYDRLYIAASPKFMGMLRNAISKEIKNLISQELTKDLTTIQSKELWNYFN